MFANSNPANHTTSNRSSGNGEKLSIWLQRQQKLENKTIKLPSLKLVSVSAVSTDPSQLSGKQNTKNALAALIRIHSPTRAQSKMPC